MFLDLKGEERVFGPYAGYSCCSWGGCDSTPRPVRGHDDFLIYNIDQSWSYIFQTYGSYFFLLCITFSEV